MWTELVRTSPVMVDFITAGVVLCTFLAVALGVRVLWRRVVAPLVKKTNTDLDDTLFPPLRGLIVWAIILSGVYHSAASLQYLQSHEGLRDALSKFLSVAWLVLAVYTCLKTFNGIVYWYVRRQSEKSEGVFHMSDQVNLVRKVINALMLALGLVYLLRAVGVDVSPLLASGAIGGLAVALALQDTLANFFAGIFLAVDRPVRVGDFIKLESGEEGFVEEIGWRNTKVRPWANNLVIIPNSKLSQSIVTNYHLPQQEMSVYVPCGVSYDSDLQRVEDVTVEVAREVMARVEGAQTSWEPVVRWKEFGDFAVTFLAVLRVRDFGTQYLLHSEFVKALHRRYQEEGIEIPFPIRTVVMKSPQPVPSQREPLSLLSSNPSR